jgi:hypothetical protein
MKTWHLLFGALVIAISDFCGGRFRRLARRFHIL